MENISHYITLLAQLLKSIGVLIIFVGFIYALCIFFKQLLKADPSAFSNLRQSLGQSILLGLEVLIGADIIDTITTEASIESVTILGLVILIRTFLSLSLQVELEGRFPWQRVTKNNA